MSQDWSLIANIRNIFNSIKQDIVEFKTENANGNLFNSSADKASIKISFAGNRSGEIKNAIDKVKDNYKDFGRLEVLKNDQNSGYYKNKQHEVLSHYEKVPEKRTINYDANEAYVVRPAYTTQEDHGQWGLVPRFMGIKVGEKEWHSHWVTINHPAEYGTRLVKKTKTVTEMVKKPVFNIITNREFDAEKYNATKSVLQEYLKKNVQNATAVMGGIPEDHDKVVAKEDVQHADQPVRDLLIKWQDAEINQYFYNNPANSLEVLDIEVIGNNLESVVDVAQNY